MKTIYMISLCLMLGFAFQSPKKTPHSIDVKPFECCPFSTKIDSIKLIKHKIDSVMKNVKESQKIIKSKQK